MNPTEIIPGNPEDVQAEWQQTLDDLVKGIRRPGQMKIAYERMDRRREENRQLFGEQHSAVELIRETRDQPRF